ncbi:aldo/keto reductase [Parablautia intestinalis]|uniref:Aldo/keto reductase n=1 Tax=Parablautia intestinalis TaxID=2320100 RepID=A0A3A9AQG3_9FIRM|nr:aldo/keto reductase [Parablautia intestinalis]RKI93597.1 aldo/keto reductase [Parablautia intestinalis]
MDKRIRIPDTDLSVFPIGLGTVDAGLLWDGKDADAIFETYLSQGGNLVDCAHVYSDWVMGETARAERVVGDWLQRSGKRKEIVLITKGGHPNMKGENVDLHCSRMTHKDMVKDLNESLMQLRTDYIDLYFYHRDDLSQTVEEEIETMEEFVKAGKIRYYGCSNWTSERMREADDYCARKGYRGFVADQSLLNLGMKYFKGLADDTLAYTRGDAWDYHVENLRNLEMPYMGNCSGFFHIFAQKGEAGVKENPYYTPGNVAVAERMRILRKRYDCTITQCVLGFFYHQPFPCVPLYGPARPEHVKDACGTLDIPFTDADYEWLLKPDI